MKPERMSICFLSLGSMFSFFLYGPGEYRKSRNPGEYWKGGIRASIEKVEFGRVSKK